MIIINTGVRPAKWVSPSSKFESVSSISFSVDYVWVKLSIVWSLVPLNEFLVVDVFLGLEEFSELTLNLLSDGLSSGGHDSIHSRKLDG